MRNPIRVMVVDDSAVVRQTLKELLNQDPGIEVVSVAPDPIFALSKIEADRPDVIISDLEMPRMDGLTFLKQVAEQYRIPVVICSSKTEAGSDNALRAMEYGAIDIILKPKLGTKQFLEDSRVEFCDVVRAAAMSRGKVVPRAAPSVQTAPAPKLSADVMLPKPGMDTVIETTERVVVVGASTGGTEALKEFLEVFPEDAPGMVIVQHMPEHFTAAFAKRLDSLCRITVKEAADGDSVIRGRALIAPGNRHTLLKRSGARYYVEVKDGPLVCRHRPSVDVLFRSAARYAGKNAVGVIMTGMGDDGARGMRELHDSGAWCLAQDEASCIVFGMPNEAIKLGGVDAVHALSALAGEVQKRTR